MYTNEAKVLKQAEVLERTGLSRSTLWRLERKASFPQRVQLSSRSVGWIEADVNAWIASRPRGIGRRH